MQRAPFGSPRQNASNYNAVNILTLIKKLNNEYPFCEREYDHLSEYAHPNLKGGLMA